MARGQTIAPLLPFWAATLPPLGLLAAGCLAGSVWLLAALVWVTVLALVLDQLPSPLPLPQAGGTAEFPAGDGLLFLLGAGQLLLLPLVVWTVAGSAGPAGGDRLLAFLAAALILGQIGMPVAHELIHRRGRWQSGLGTAILIAVLFGHHASSHPLVHHVRVATRADPNTARRGETLYRFLPRAWAGSFRAGYAAETVRRRRAAPPWWRPHPYAVHLAGATACLGLALALAGPAGIAVWAGLGLWASAQLLSADYVQHYGLARAILPDGRTEPVAAHHAWNAPQWFSGALGLNAPRHSDHHLRPGRGFAGLQVPPGAPMLPGPLPLMALAALIPPLWRRLIHPRLDRQAAGPGDPAARDAARGLGRPPGDLAQSEHAPAPCPEPLPAAGRAGERG
jgi:alkane 1-monooxygenase